MTVNDRSQKDIGHIFQINRSQGGVPKLAVHKTNIGLLGLVGDMQNNTKIHGGPERAVCLYSLERILALQEEGHPIFPGSTGENLTISGLEWESMQPGVRLSLGTQVILEVTRYTNPCQNITGSFLAGNSNRISQTLHPGSSRVYARVLQTGTVQVGDIVRVAKIKEVS